MKDLKFMNKFSFEEALSFMKCGFKVMGPGNRVYSIENGQLICYPKPIDRPKQRRNEVKFNVESMLSNDWSLYETESE